MGRANKPLPLLVIGVVMGPVARSPELWPPAELACFALLLFVSEFFDFAAAVLVALFAAAFWPLYSRRLWPFLVAAIGGGVVVAAVLPLAGLPILVELPRIA
jgi:hypothetical protein